MKNKIIRLVYLFSALIVNTSVISQINFDKDNLVVQKKSFKNAKKYLCKRDTINALRSFQYAYLVGKKSRIGKKSFNKFNNILDIKRAQLIKRIAGRWKLKISNSYLNQMKDTTKYHFLEIKKDTIYFFKKILNVKKLVHREKISFSDVSNYYVNNYFTFDFSSKEIWTFELSIKDILKVKKEGYYNNKGRRINRSCSVVSYYDREAQ